ncbi:type II secretion system protein [Geminisphaera colitermitum]|uniref:type II secretion system protein n=1 Tax=Geminisphaera colitermitum TaxID=1148786 RepID=UPI000158CF52|nr:type II secretion system protein [Geminisphaera colitermitum]
MNTRTHRIRHAAAPTLNEPPPLPELAQVTGRSPVKNPFPASSASPPASAFTLIELLTVVAIIGILSAILVVTISAARKASYRAKCVSNMRGVGYGILNHVNDHRGRLPGPLGTDQHGAEYKSNSNGTGFATNHSIGSALGEYLDLKPPQPGGSSQRADVLVCPAWDAVTQKKSGNTTYDSVLWRLNRRDAFGGGTYRNRNISEVETLVTTPEGPANNSPSKIRLMWELDAINQAGYKCPPPVHGSIRNILYLDGHIGTRPSSEKTY